MKDIYNHIDNNVEEYVSDLQELIRIPSVSAQKIGLEECAEFVKKQMHKDGLPAELHEIPGGPPLVFGHLKSCLIYTSPSPRDQRGSRMPSSA